MHREHQMEAFIPAQPVTPADIRQAGQPACPTAFGIPDRDPGALEGLIGTARRGQAPNEMQKKRHEGCVLLADLPVALLPGGQGRQGGPEMARRVAVKTPFTAKALPLSKHPQGHHLAAAQGGLGPRMELGRHRGLAKVIDHNIKSRQEGVHIDHRRAPYLGEDRAILPAGGTFCLTASYQFTPSV